MTQKIGIIDYGLSNLLSIYRAFAHVGAEVSIITEAKSVSGMDKIVLPGVGSFPDGMKLLHDLGFVAPLIGHAAAGKPFLGVCLGMQMMLSRGFEMEETPGLNLIPGDVLPLPALDAAGKPNRIPHVGWEFLREPEHGRWKETPLSEHAEVHPFYFVHSYYARPEHTAHVWAEADFAGFKFAAAVRNGLVFGTQFHPEKSGSQGLELLHQFVTL
ncbi:MAG: Imidazole glycerol phosphate synthase subunit HisH [Bacteroidota bacterium]|jgi:glutamine amidotransferase